MSTSYFYRKGEMPLGPYDLNTMRGLARQGRVGRSYKISTDEGATWLSGDAFPEIFAPQEDVPVELEPPPSEQTTRPTGPSSNTEWYYYTPQTDRQGPVSETEIKKLIASGTLSAYDSVWAPILGENFVEIHEIPTLATLLPTSRDPVRVAKKKGRRSARNSLENGEQNRASGAGISGFICSVVASVLLAIPCLVWALYAESFLWIFIIVVPGTVLGVIGLVLSVIGLRKQARGLATTGTVLGVIAIMLATMSSIAWATLPYRRQLDRWPTIQRHRAEIVLETNTVDKALRSYRGIRPPDDPFETDPTYQAEKASARKSLGTSIGDLLEAYDNHVSITAGTWLFQEAFEGLNTLKSLIETDVKQAANAEGLQAIDVLESGGVNIDKLTTLMDTLYLYERNDLTLQQAEAKLQAH